jgi:hypothetical protein
MRFVARVMLFAVWFWVGLCVPGAWAKPSPYAAMQFSGDRYIAPIPVAQKQPVVRHSRHAKVRYFYRQKRAPAGRARPWLADPPITVAQGFRREVARAGTVILGGRPAGCPARSWCGCWLASHLGMRDRSLWLARNWAHVGSSSGPRPGAIVVWRHHVGKITAVNGHRIRVLSGNDGRRVRERWRTTAGVIAYRTRG